MSKQEAIEKIQLSNLMDQMESVKSRLAKEEAIKLEQEIAEWIEEQSREDLEQLLRKGNTSWYVGPSKANMDISTHIREYLEFLDRCDEEKVAQDQLRKEHGLWGIFG